VFDGWCDDSTNNADCLFDAGDCCPGDCVPSTYSCYDATCDTCLDTDSADWADGGDCYGYEASVCGDDICQDDESTGDYGCYADCGCGDTEFDCAAGGSYGNCFPLSWTCDGADDCSDGSDETDCGGTQTCADQGLFSCTEEDDGSECIYTSWACDGWAGNGSGSYTNPDCSTGADEDLDYCCGIEDATYVDAGVCGEVEETCATSDCGLYLIGSESHHGWSCWEIENYSSCGYDCTTCADEGYCEADFVVDECGTSAGSCYEDCSTSNWNQDCCTHEDCGGGTNYCYSYGDPNDGANTYCWSSGCENYDDTIDTNCDGVTDDSDCPGGAFAGSDDSIDLITKLMISSKMSKAGQSLSSVTPSQLVSIVSS
jgi:hypothetical protein